VFSSDQRWVQYEAIQADIFDHLLAALPEFGLRPFQFPSDAVLRTRTV
jgi:miniconductance mechanosensitive channel